MTETETATATAILPACPRSSDAPTDPAAYAVSARRPPPPNCFVRGTALWALLCPQGLAEGRGRAPTTHPCGQVIAGLPGATAWAGQTLGLRLLSMAPAPAAALSLVSGVWKALSHAVVSRKSGSRMFTALCNARCW